MWAAILNVPKGFHSESWNHSFINIMPAGVFSIANYSRSRGHFVRVVNGAAFGDTQSALKSMFERLERWRCEVVGLPIHWHLSALDTLQVVGEIKARFPGMKQSSEVSPLRSTGMISCGAARSSTP